MLSRAQVWPTLLNIISVSSLSKHQTHSDHERFVSVNLVGSKHTRNMDLSATLAVAGIILALLLWFGGKKRQKLPPGPFALPVIGNLPLLEKEAPFKSFIEVSLVETLMCISFFLRLLPGHIAS